jgi:hypothetical protein
MSELGAAPFFVLLAAAVTSSLLIAVLYQHFFAETATGSQFYRAFSLLGLSITALFVTVQFSLPLSIGLLAALSIVRFRTPIKEPEEVGILMVLVAAAVASATFKLQFLGILLAMSFAALALQSRLRSLGQPRQGRQLVTISLPTPIDERPTAFNTMVTRHVRGGRLERVTADAREIVVSFSLPGGARPDLDALRSDLGQATTACSVSIQVARIQQ